MVSRFETSVDDILYCVVWGKATDNDGRSSYQGSMPKEYPDPRKALREYQRLCRKHPQDEVRIYKDVKITRSRTVTPEELMKIS